MTRTGSKSFFNIGRKLKSAFKDVLANLAMSLEVDRELAYQLLASQLEDRIITSMDKSVFIDSFSYPSLYEFDPRNPIESIFEVEGKKYSLKELPYIYDTPLARLEGRAGIVDDVKAGFASWHNDYAEQLKMLNAKVKGNEETYKFMMKKIKKYRWGKYLWRLLTAVANFTAVTIILHQISGFFYAFYMANFKNMSWIMSKGELKTMFLYASIPVIIFKLMKLIESAFMKKKVNIEKFDSISKQSSSFPEIQKFLTTYYKG